MATKKPAITPVPAPAPKPVKAAKAVAPVPAAKAPRVSGSKNFPADNKIVVLADKNPKRPTSASFLRFGLYAKNKTVAAFIAAGGTYADLKYDTEHQFVRVG